MHQAGARCRRSGAKMADTAHAGLARRIQTPGVQPNSGSGIMQAVVVGRATRSALMNQLRSPDFSAEGCLGGRRVSLATISWRTVTDGHATQRTSLVVTRLRLGRDAWVSGSSTLHCDAPTRNAGGPDGPGARRATLHQPVQLSNKGIGTAGMPFDRHPEKAGTLCCAARYFSYPSCRETAAATPRRTYPAERRRQVSTMPRSASAGASAEQSVVVVAVRMTT